MSEISEEIKQKAAEMEVENDLITIPRGLLGAALAVIKRPDFNSDNVIELLRYYAYTKKAPGALRERAEPDGYRKLFTCSSCGAEGLDEPLESRCHCNGDGARWIEGRLYTAPPATVVSKIDRKAICNKAHWLCARSPGATFYNAAEFALDEVMELLAPPAPVVTAETFDEWSRRCEIQLTLCRPEFREVAEITWNACRAAMLAAPGKN
ncbi:hypothetical protein AAAW61_003806 [Cronobacter sakazakii]